MQIKLRTLAGVASLSLMATSAMAVLPTVSLDPADTTTQTTDTLAPAMPVVLMPTSSQLAAQSPIQSPTQSPATATTSNAASQIQKRLLASVVSRDATGAETLSPITAQTKLAKGNILEYHGYIINRSPERVRNVKVTFDIPANTELTSVADLSPNRAYASVDKVNFQFAPLKANIGGVLQEIPTASYKALQWNVQGLGLNEVAEVKFRVRVK